ncbi:hypothetical protein KKHLCK_08925 [Candidatus Electrothrix laxa]
MKKKKMRKKAAKMGVKAKKMNKTDQIHAIQIDVIGDVPR